MGHMEKPPEQEIKCGEHPDRPPKPEAECGEHHRPPKPGIGFGGHHPHPPFHMFPHPPFHVKIKHHPPMGWTPHDFDFYLSLVDELSLSEEQVKKLQSIKIECEKSKIMTRARIGVGGLELQELLDQPVVDRGKVDAKIKEIGEIKTEGEINDIHAMIDAREVLTPEQKEKLRKLRPTLCNSCF